VDRVAKLRAANCPAWFMPSFQDTWPKAAKIIPMIIITIAFSA
jgi:hypothetical protein